MNAQMLNDWTAVGSLMGLTLLLLSLILNTIHSRPFTLFLATSEKISRWSLIETSTSLLGIVVYLGIEWLKGNIPFVIIFLIVGAAIIFAPFLTQVRLGYFKNKLAKYKLYSDMVKNQSLDSQSRWWRFINRDLNVVFAQDRLFWKEGYPNK